MSVKGAAVKRLFFVYKEYLSLFYRKKFHCLRYLSEAAV